MPSTAAFLHADIHALQAIVRAHVGMLAARRAMLQQRDAAGDAYPVAFAPNVTFPGSEDLLAGEKRVAS